MRLVEITSFPADVHELRKSFSAEPWARDYVGRLTRELCHLLLKENGQLLGPSQPFLPEARGWAKVGERGAFPHP